MASQSQLSALDYAEMSFGQSVVVTPIEMLAAVNAIANGGVWVQPHAVTAIVSPTTGVSTPVAPVTRRVIPQPTAQTLTTMLTGVVDDSGGEGFMARIPGFQGEVALKTGTAQEPTNGTYQGDLSDSVVGYLPASNPQFTMLVDINDPHVPANANYGSILAAPVFKQMAEEMIDLWRINP
jgi:cell division protein FtsI/penicillin-binding protein 2